MALGERDPNASGHTSRASNMSAGSRGLLQPKTSSVTRSDLLSSAPGVASMLRTSTELGNIGGIAYDTCSNMPNVPRAPHRSGASSRMSTASSRSNISRRDSRRVSTQHNAWPSGSSGVRHSMTRNVNVPDYVADTLSPTVMNLPGSSPLIPRSRTCRDGRSRSMTHTSQPHFSLNSNRSYSSLRSYDLVQRPRSPYDGYPQNFRRPGGMRPVSPAVSDYADVQNRRWHGNQGYPRTRMPSDTLIRRDNRGQGMSRPPSRSRSPAYYANPQHHSDVPPVPPIPAHHRHKAVSQARIAHNQARGSVSSRSINQRTDSEAPSSDGPSPPTPKDGAPMGALLSPRGSQMMIATGVVTSKIEQTGVDYYDGSEEYYEREDFALPDNETVVTGYGYGIRTILEERLSGDQPHNRRSVASRQEEHVAVPDTGIEGRVELPASPVPRRITREMVLKVIREPVSTNDDTESPGGSPETKDFQETKGAEQIQINEVDKPKEEIAIGNNQGARSRDFRHSIVSQAQTSLMESSTVELAVRYSSPDANGTASANGTTEDGMSELLDGYQHTEIISKSEGDSQHKPSPDRDGADRKSIHTRNSSDQQSFKTCTDVPEQPCKDPDGRSTRTCKDTETPERTASIATPGLPTCSSNAESKPQGPSPDMTMSSPPAVLRKKHAFPLGESSFQKISRMRASSKLSSRQGSTVTSVSSNEGTVIQTQPVPLKESSISKEPQRSAAVAGYLLRGFRSGGRFSSLSKIRNELSSQPSSNEDVLLPDAALKETQDASKGGHNEARPDFPWTENGRQYGDGPVTEPNASSKGCDKKSAQPTNLSNMLANGSLSGGRALLGIPEVQMGTPAHNRATSTPSAAIIPEPSSVYSSDNNSSSYRARVKSSPADISKTPEHSRRDSQTTTHLVWPSRKSLHVRSTTPPERPRQSHDQDDTTTDLRLSSYRQPMQMHYLPDLKEESHEDSSLNTSASNLKHSSFRFPNAGQHSIRASVDDSILPTRNGSLRSRRNSGFAQIRGLPSMNFSGMDLAANLQDLLGPYSIGSSDSASEEVSVPCRGSITRSATEGAMREKYKSVFGVLERGEKAAAGERTSDLIALKSRYTTQDIMSDIEKLDVPSVGNLTERISELFPGLREVVPQTDEATQGEFVEEEQIIEHVMDELQEVGAPGQKRSEARLRPLPGSPQLMVVNDAVYEELTRREKEGETGATGHETKSSDATCRSLGVNDSHHGDRSLAELEAPCGAKLRPRSLSYGALSYGDRPASRQSVRRSQLSLPSTPTASTDTHPWYNDKNFPWATTTIPSIDISLPAPAAVRNSPRLGPSPLRSRISNSSERTISSGQDREGSSGMAHLSDSTGEVRNLRVGRLHRANKIDLDGALSPPDFDRSGLLNAPINTSAAIQSHEAGDRYPTSSLSPPSHTNLPSLQPPLPARLSPDSDDVLTIPRKRRLSLLPHLSTSRRAASISQAADRTSQAQNQPQPLSETQEGANHNVTQSRRLTFLNARGLTRQEFEMARFKENVKSAWYKFKRGVRKIIYYEPSIQEIVRSPRRAGDRPIPDEVEEHRARMPEGYYSFEGPREPRRLRLSVLFDKVGRGSGGRST